MKNCHHYQKHHNLSLIGFPENKLLRNYKSLAVCLA